MTLLVQILPSQDIASRLVWRLSQCLETVTNDHARACVFWLATRYSTSATKEVVGALSSGIAIWVPDLLRNAVKGFVNEVSERTSMFSSMKLS